VKPETARTASARRSAHVASASAGRPSRARTREPYSRVEVRQSPCTSTTSFARDRVAIRPSSHATPSNALSATTASGANERSSRATRAGSVA
jgi:hypothetical protein